MKDLQDIVHELKARGVALKATEQPVDTGTAAGKAFLDMLGVFAEFETNLRRERQLEGIKAAKARGVYKGRKPASTRARCGGCARKRSSGPRRSPGGSGLAGRASIACSERVHRERSGADVALRYLVHHVFQHSRSTPLASNSKDGLPPRPSILVITKEDGRLIGASRLPGVGGAAGVGVVEFRARNGPIPIRKEASREQASRVHRRHRQSRPPRRRLPRGAWLRAAERRSCDLSTKRTSRR